MTVVLLAFLMGIVAGLRTFMAPAAVSWASHAEAEGSVLNLLTKSATVIAMYRTPVTPSSAANMRASPPSGTISPYPIVESVIRLK